MEEFPVILKAPRPLADVDAVSVEEFAERLYAYGEAPLHTTSVPGGGGAVHPAGADELGGVPFGGE
jgi:hypothetical protein